MQDSIHQFDELARFASFIFLVYYRGHWCPFCMSYLKKLQQLSGPIEQAKGAVVAVTAEPGSQIAHMRKSSGYQGLTISDPENVLVAELKKRQLLDVAITEKKGYSHGMAQPAILIIQSEKVLYHWTIVPSMMNFGGAKDRPVLDQVWANVQSQLNGKGKAFDKVDGTSAFGLLREKLFG